jgi:protein tyrosine phosphatase (PTP) superfamily phosphohydrolase (DUF442 family)
MFLLGCFLDLAIDGGFRYAYSTLKVAKFRTKLAMPDDPMQVNCDAGSLRCFVTYIVKRHDGARRREP